MRPLVELRNQSKSYKIQAFCLPSVGTSLSYQRKLYRYILDQKIADGAASAIWEACLTKSALQLIGTESRTDFRFSTNPGTKTVPDSVPIWSLPVIPKIVPAKMTHRPNMCSQLSLKMCMVCMNMSLLCLNLWFISITVTIQIFAVSCYEICYQMCV